ncbi:MAG: hypothetical protein K0S37_460 [Microbacterium sp.]|jgi:hypothetical protein|nr:hypothetical protein [Microbacterium sp.]
MSSLPRSSDSLLVLSVSGRAAEWQALLGAVRIETEDGFRAYVEVVDDKMWHGATAEELRDAVPCGDDRAAVLFAADERTLSEPGFPVLVIDLVEHRPAFRCVAEQLWSVDNNLNIANMDWEEFADAVDETGVYRGV